MQKVLEKRITKVYKSIEKNELLYYNIFKYIYYIIKKLFHTVI
jgi:hypothetical protein